MATGQQRASERRDSHSVLVAGSADFRNAAADLARRLGRPEEDVIREVTAALRELDTTHDPVAMAAWRRLSRWLTRAYQFDVDECALDRLQALDRDHSLLWLPSHVSYLDAWVLPETLELRHLSPTFGLAGINLSLWPLGPLGRRIGWLFIRRSSRDPNYAAAHPQSGDSDDRVYRLAVRLFIAHLLQGRNNLAFSLEGGRTRTGKLRPPHYALMRYAADAVRAHEGPDVMLVPIAIVYDQLRELPTVTAEATGLPKPKEGVRWLMRLARQQRDHLGRVYVRFGEPVPLRSRLEEIEAEAGAAHALERVVLEVYHGINNATPVTPTAIVALALLGAGHAVTLAELTAGIDPLARYLRQRSHPVSGDTDMSDPAHVRRALDVLVRSGVVTSFDGGTEPVFGLVADRHLVAAFYRNTAIHFLVPRAIAELVLLRIEQEHPEDLEEASWREALRLRDLLKFEFFFPRRRDFADELRAEIALIDDRWLHDVERGVSSSGAREWLDQAHPHVAHLVLRPFLEAYLVVGERLADHPAGEALDTERFLRECLGVAQQWYLQGRLASAESVSLELFRTALRLARHRGLLDARDPEVGQRRQDFAAELRQTVRLVAELERRAHSPEEGSEMASLPEPAHGPGAATTGQGTP
jgi:glycerol-3-phosphate O-acyltransferase